MGGGNETETTPVSDIHLYTSAMSTFLCSDTATEVKPKVWDQLGLRRIIVFSNCSE